MASITLAKTIPTKLTISNTTESHTVVLAPMTTNPNRNVEIRHEEIQLHNIEGEYHTMLTIILTGNDVLPNRSLETFIKKALNYQIEQISDQDIDELYNKGLLGTAYNNITPKNDIRKLLKTTILERYKNMSINGTNIPDDLKPVIANIFGVKEFYYTIPSGDLDENPYPGEC